MGGIDSTARNRIGTYEFVTSGNRDPLGRNVVHKGSARDHVGLEIVEGEGHDGSTHHLPNATALMDATEPRSSLERRDRCRRSPMQTLRSHYRPIDEDNKVQIKLIVGEIGSPPPMMLEETPLELRRRSVSPRNGERHRLRRMNASKSNLGQLRKVFVRRHPQRQRRRNQAKAEQRPFVNQGHSPCWTGTVPRSERILADVEPPAR